MAPLLPCEEWCDIAQKSELEDNYLRAELLELEAVVREEIFCLFGKKTPNQSVVLAS
jgi:hypothetical protein